MVARDARDARDDITAFTGDETGAEVLRRSLRELAAARDGDPLGRRIEEVLAGRLGMRELAADPELVRFAQEGMAAFDELWREMGPGERDEALRLAQQYEDDLDHHQH